MILSQSILVGYVMVQRLSDRRRSRFSEYRLRRPSSDERCEWEEHNFERRRRRISQTYRRRLSWVHPCRQVISERFPGRPCELSNIHGWPGIDKALRRSSNAGCVYPLSARVYVLNIFARFFISETAATTSLQAINILCMRERKTKGKKKRTMQLITLYAKRQL